MQSSSPLPPAEAFPVQGHESGEATSGTPEAGGFPLLDDIEARLLGCLVEKQLSTPDYYPMTLNSLVTACNQKNNRQPVVALDDKTVVKAVDRLREHKFVWMLHMAGARVPKYEHRLGERLFIDSEGDMAVLAELLVRGPQTAGQLRAHVERMHPFVDVSAVQGVLDGLAARGVPIVARLPQLPGRKEARYMHLLSGEPAADEVAPIAPVEAARMAAAGEEARIAAVEARVDALERQCAETKAAFDAFRGQFQ